MAEGRRLFVHTREIIRTGLSGPQVDPYLQPHKVEDQQGIGHAGQAGSKDLLAELEHLHWHGNRRVVLERRMASV